MGIVDPPAIMAAQKKIGGRAVPLAGKRSFFEVIGMTLAIISFAGAVSEAADFHTNAVFNVNISLPAQAQKRTGIPKIPEFTVTNLWVIAPSNDPGSLITTDGASQRTIAYNALSNHLYLVSRGSSVESNYIIYALTTIVRISQAVTNISDGVTNVTAAVTNVPGTVVSTLNTSGIYNGGAVGEGGIGLASIAVADDGAIYACNMSVDACGCGPNAGNPADSLFRIYRWADGNSNTVPVQIFSGDPAGQAVPLRWGDTLAVRASGTDTQILLDSADGTYVALLAPSDASMTIFTNTSFANSSAPLTPQGRSLQFAGTDSFLRKGKGTSMQLAKWNTAKHNFSISDSARLPATAGPVATNGFGLLAAIDFNGGSTGPDNIKLYDLSNFKTPGLQDQGNFPINQQSNPDFEGQVVFVGGAIWALDANNGLVALQVLGPHLITFLTIEPGHIGNKEIIQALAGSLHSNNLSGAKLILKTDQLGTDHFKSKFRLRKGTNDIDVSVFLSFDLPASVSAETIKGTLTNAVDYTVTHFSLSASGLSFDVQGFGVWKSSPVIDHGQTIEAQPFPNSITVSSLDGVGISGSQELTFHGSATITGRKIEVSPNQPPTISLTSPSNGQTNTAPNTIILRASAKDDDGSISKVEFYQDGNKLGESLPSPGSSFFAFTWTNTPAGTFGVYAKSIDDDGASGFSATNTITINPAP